MFEQTIVYTAHAEIWKLPTGQVLARQIIITFS